tara:strand:- start:1879 stop:3087 length:1209 start_codon:yes stop_codon:yes gene_type:complete
MEKIKSKKFIKFYFYLLVFTTVFYLTSLHLNLSNSITEWLINYQGGFTRRGLSGEILFQISIFFDFELKKTILFVQCLTYIIFFYLVYIIIKEVENYNLVYLSIFSAIFLFFPIAELEALGRKEILVSILLLTLIVLKNYTFNVKIYIIFFLSIFVLLIHEIIVFHLLYFLAFLFILNRTNNFSNNLKIILFSFIFLICSWLLFKNFYSIEMKEEMCKSLLENLDVICGFQTHYVANPIATYMGEVPFPNWKPEWIIRHSFIVLFGYGPLLILSIFTNFDKNKSNYLVHKIPVIIVLIFLIIPTYLIFYISVDSGRYHHLSYSMAFIFFFGLKFNELIIFDETKLKKFERILFPKSKVLSCMIIFIVCFTWNPKAVYHEDLGSIPIYRTFEKIDNFIINLKW